MHELGIVTYVAREVEKIAAENQAAEVETVVLEIGEVSGIIPEYLVDCWNYFKKRYPSLVKSELRCEEQKGVTYCETCGQEYSTTEYGRICPHCGSGHTYLLTGRECSIKEIIAA